MLRMAKGKQVKIPAPGCGFFRGNATKRGDGCGGPGKSYLFFLTARPPWKRFIRREGNEAGRARHVCRVRCALEVP